MCYTQWRVHLFLFYKIPHKCKAFFTYFTPFDSFLNFLLFSRPSCFLAQYCLSNKFLLPWPGEAKVQKVQAVLTSHHWVSKVKYTSIYVNQEYILQIWNKIKQNISLINNLLEKWKTNQECIFVQHLCCRNTC